MPYGPRCLVLAVLAWWPATIASAHLGSAKYLDVALGEEEVVVDVAVEAVDASMELGLGETVDEDALAHDSDRIGAWLTEGIHVESAGGPCRATPSPILFTTRDERRFIELTLRYECQGTGPYVLEDTTIFEDDPQHEAFVRVALSGDTDARILRRGRQRTELGTPPTWQSLVTLYLMEGAIHLATGYDHILFLLSLVLAAGLVAVRRSQKDALRDVAIIVTSFTVGHSVTLVAAALEWVVLPTRPVEALIALSIVVVALMNVIKPGDRRPMPYLAVGFGLIHGFGFSSVLAEQGLPAQKRVLALVSFNIGIEVAQLLFVALLLWPLARLARNEVAYQRWLVRGGSFAIAALAGVWFVERAFL